MSRSIGAGASVHATDGVKTVKALRQDYGDTLFFILIFTAAVSHPRRSLRFHCGSIQTILLNGLPAFKYDNLPQHFSVAFATQKSALKMIEAANYFVKCPYYEDICSLIYQLKTSKMILVSFYRLINAETQ